MANPKHLALLRSGVQYWNTWRKEHPKWIPRLNGAVLDDLDLHNLDLRGALMRRTSLRRARLDGSLMSPQGRVAEVGTSEVRSGHEESKKDYSDIGDNGGLYDLDQAHLLGPLSRLGPTLQCICRK